MFVSLTRARGKLNSLFMPLKELKNMLKKEMDYAKGREKERDRVLEKVRERVTEG